MSKRAIFVFGGVILFFVCFYIGFNFLGKEENTNNIIINTAEMRDKTNNEVKNEIVVEVSSNEEKTTPNTILVLKKFYKDCGHTISGTSTIPEDMVNLNEEEIKKSYSNWKVEKFSKEEIVLYKELESFCGEHYLLSEENDYISIYIVNEDGSTSLKEKGKISTEYLPEMDRIS